MDSIKRFRVASLKPLLSGVRTIFFFFSYFNEKSQSNRISVFKFYVFSIRLKDPVLQSEKQINVSKLFPLNNYVCLYVNVYFLSLMLPRRERRAINYHTRIKTALAWSADKWSIFKIVVYINISNNEGVYRHTTYNKTINKKIGLNFALI